MKFLKGLVTTILVTLSTAFLISFVAIFSTSKILSKNNITKMIEEIDMDELVGDSMDQIDVSLDELNLPDKYAKRLLKDEKLQAFVSDYFKKFSDAIINDEKMPQIDSKEASSILKASIDTIISEAREDGYTNINERDVQRLYNIIDENIEEFSKSMQETSDEIDKVFKDAGNEVMFALRIVYRTKYIFIALTVICLGLACLLRLKEHKYLKFLKNVTLTYGIILLIPGIIINCARLEIDALKGNAQVIAKICIESLGFVFVVTGAVCILIAIICMILNKVLKNKVVEDTHKQIIEEPTKEDVTEVPAEPEVAEVAEVKESSEVTEVEEPMQSEVTEIKEPTEETKTVKKTPKAKSTGTSKSSQKPKAKTSTTKKSTKKTETKNDK